MYRALRNKLSHTVTVFLYQYTTAAKNIVTLIDLGVSLLYIAILFVMLAWGIRHRSEIDSDPTNKSFLIYFFKAFHMPVVELLQQQRFGYMA
jgi:hypothetical protein